MRESSALEDHELGQDTPHKIEFFVEDVYQPCPSRHR